MKSKVNVLIIGTVLLLSLSGCGSPVNNTTPANNASTGTGTSNPSMTNMTDMGNMTMGNQTPNQTSSADAQNTALTQAFQDELNGFTTIQKDVKQGDWANATRLAGNLHNEFHAAILPPLKAKKGNTYAEDIHSKYDALQDAISSKNQAQITQLIQVNRTNLSTVAKILSVTLPK